MGSSFFSNPTDYEVVQEGGEGSSFYDGPAYTEIDPVAVAAFATQAAASAAAAAASAAAAAASAAEGSGAAGDTLPLMDGVASAGTADPYAREDHVHPTDTSRASVTYVDAQDATLTAAVALKAALASPALTGNPTAPTQSAGNNSTRLATTAYVDTADALKAPLASPTFTGTPAAPTAAASDDSTTLATTAHVKANFGAWTAYTPTVSATSGTFTSASAAGRYLQVGKTVFFNLTVTITTNGTAAGAVVATLPVAAKSVAVFFGREDAVTGSVFQAKSAAASANVNMFTFSNTYPGGSGYQLVISGTYEAN